MLIDGGITHNFIDQTIATMYMLPVNREKNFQVMVANGKKIECAGQCRALTITIQGHSITTNYYVLPVVACQLVLGVQWLKILGSIETNYKELTMTFKVGGDFHTFQGLRHPKIGRAFG